jgi:hypothetical protein
MLASSRHAQGTASSGLWNRSLPLEQGLLRKLPSLQGHFHRLTPETVPLLEHLVAFHQPRSTTP